MGRDEGITAIEPALAPSLERRLRDDHIALENEVTRPRVIREQWVCAPYFPEIAAVEGRAGRGHTAPRLLN